MFFDKKNKEFCLLSKKICIFAVEENRMLWHKIIL